MFHIQLFVWAEVVSIFHEMILSLFFFQRCKLMKGLMQYLSLMFEDLFSVFLVAPMFLHPYSCCSNHERGSMKSVGG